MTLLRAAIGLLVLAAAALVVSWVVESGGAGGGATLPEGSSSSYRSDGAQALFAWVETLGGAPLRLERLDAASVDAESGAATLLVLQPLTPLGRSERPPLDQAATHGGTLVFAGDSLALRATLVAFSIALEPGPILTSASDPASGQVVPLEARNRVSSGAAGAEPLLVDDAGAWVALRQPYRGGTLVVVATAQPLTNAGLRDPETARWVYRALLRPAVANAGRVLFDEGHHGPSAGDGDAGPDLRALVVSSPAGQALLYALAVTLLYLLLAGRRLGPPLPPFRAGQASRSMSEHVQALADLFRRARRARFARAHFASVYRGRVARSLGADPRDAGLASAEILAARGAPPAVAASLAHALAALDRAPDEVALLRAVAEAERALAAVPRAGRATLSPMSRPRA